MKIYTKQFGQLQKILTQAFIRLSPQYMIKNSILFLVWIAAVSANLILIYYFYNNSDDIKIFCHLTFWLWTTLFFANVAESIAINRTVIAEEKEVSAKEPEILVKKLKNLKNLNHFSIIPTSKLSQGDLIILEAGESVPRDGVVVWGKSFVNEADITGEVKSLIKSLNHRENKIKAGSVVESDKLIIKVHDLRGYSIFSNISRLMTYIDREKSPLEIALQSMIIGLSLLFISISIGLKCLANYIGIEIPILYLIALTVTLIPTTISGLLPLISITGANILRKKNIVLKDTAIIDNALDVNVIVFDKTGTITEGRRVAVDFIPARDKDIKDLAKAAYISSLQDKTVEGESIVALAKKKFSFLSEDINFDHYINLPFSANTRISGCNYKSTEIRKGAFSGICKYLGIEERDLDSKLHKIKEEIAEECGTPMLVAMDKQILGVIYLRDKIKRRLKKQISILKEHNMLTIMMTGDNELTASYIAKKIGVHAYYSETIQSQKLTFIKKLQNHGYTVAMVGDGINDAPAIAKADLGVAFKHSNQYAIEAANVILPNHDLIEVLYLREVASIMLIKRGVLTIFSLTSDIAKYFTIIPALFSRSFPDLATLNFFKLTSLKSTILASLMFNAIIILALTPLALSTKKRVLTKKLFWRNLLIYGVGGVIAQTLGIKLFDTIIVSVGLI